MEVHFNEDTQAKLLRLAGEQGCDPETFVRETVERALHYNEWFLDEVGKGTAAADLDDFVEHDQVGQLIETRYPS